MPLQTWAATWLDSWLPQIASASPAWGVRRWRDVHQALQRQPVATSAALVEAMRLTAATVYKSLAHLGRLGVVAQLTTLQRGRVFAYCRNVDDLAAEMVG